VENLVISTEGALIAIPPASSYVTARINKQFDCTLEISGFVKNEKGVEVPVTRNTKLQALVVGSHPQLTISLSFDPLPSRAQFSLTCPTMAIFQELPMNDNIFANFTSSDGNIVVPVYARVIMRNSSVIATLSAMWVLVFASLFAYLF